MVICFWADDFSLTNILFVKKTKKIIFPYFFGVNHSQQKNIETTKDQKKKISFASPWSNKSEGLTIKTFDPNLQDHDLKREGPLHVRSRVELSCSGFRSHGCYLAHQLHDGVPVHLACTSAHGRCPSLNVDHHCIRFQSCSQRAMKRRLPCLSYAQTLQHSRFCAT